MVYKIAHISDIHLGYSSGQKRENGINLRELDGYKAFDEAIEQIIKEKPALCICTGDFFHSPAPSILTITKGQEGISKLSDHDITFVALAGNHDTLDEKASVPANRVLHSPKNNLFSFVEPYVAFDVGEDIVLHLISHHGIIEQEKTMKEIKPTDGKFNILATHGSCYDNIAGILLKTELSPREVVIPEEVLNLEWDLVLLGHLHTRMWIGEPEESNRFYAGSLLRRGFSDAESEDGRGWTLFEIDTQSKKFTYTHFNVWQRPQYEYEVDVEGKEVLAVEAEVKQFFDSLDYTDPPIVRVHFANMTPQQQVAIDWRLFADYNKKCLTSITKITPKQQIRKSADNENFAYNLIEAYEEFWKNTEEQIDREYREETRNKSVAWLKMGQHLSLEGQE